MLSPPFIVSTQASARGSHQLPPNVHPWNTDDGTMTCLATRHAVWCSICHCRAWEILMFDYPADTVSALLARGADDAPAIGAPAGGSASRPWLTHGGLRALAHRTVSDLNAMGIGRGDRVALVVPNGPEAASSFVAIACGATTAPLIPAIRRMSSRSTSAI